VKTFLIGPVRGLSEDFLEFRVKELESEGWEVYWPARDTNQDGASEYICRTNVKAIEDADAVHVVWDGKSQGCLFDLGVAFALFKPIYPIALPPPTEGKSFQNFINEVAHV